VRKFNLILIWATLSLSGCAAFASNETPAIDASAIKCPPLSVYSVEMAHKIGKEFRALPSGSALAAYVTDARNLRLQCGAK
jgi:hypothetical protein